MKKKIIGILLMVLMCFSAVLFGCENPDVASAEKEYSKEEMLAALDKTEKLNTFFIKIDATSTTDEHPRKHYLSVIDRDKESKYIEEEAASGNDIDIFYIANGFRYFSDDETGEKYKVAAEPSDSMYRDVESFLDYAALPYLKFDTSVWTRKSKNVFTVVHYMTGDENVEKLTYEITATAGLISKIVSAQKDSNGKESYTATSIISATPKAKRTDFSEYKLLT